MRTNERHRRARGDRGVVLVEAVFVLPVVIFIVFAIFEFGLLFAAQSTTNSATRDGVRFGSANFAVSGSNQAAADAIAAAVANDLSARTSLDEPIQLLIYKVDATTGLPAGGYTSCTGDCYRYTWNGSAFVFDNAYASKRWTNPVACILTDPNNPNSGLNTLDSIGAYLEVNHSYITRAFGSSLLIKEHTVSRLEPLPGSQC
jgi:Flp pilus assembly protein TadG